MPSQEGTLSGGPRGLGSLSYSCICVTSTLFTYTVRFIWGGLGRKGERRGMQITGGFCLILSYLTNFYSPPNCLPLPLSNLCFPLRTIPFNKNMCPLKGTPPTPNSVARPRSMATSLMDHFLIVLVFYPSKDSL